MKNSSDIQSGVQLGSRLDINFTSISEIKVEERVLTQSDRNLSWRTVGKPLMSKDQLLFFEQAVRTAHIMRGQPKTSYPTFKLTAIDNDGKELITANVWLGEPGMIEVNDIYCILSKNGNHKLTKLLKDAGVN